jgi:hypothetical protein
MQLYGTSSRRSLAEIIRSEEVEVFISTSFAVVLGCAAMMVDGEGVAHFIFDATVCGMIFSISSFHFRRRFPTSAQLPA